MAYHTFAKHYDALMQDVDYIAMAKHFASLIHQYKDKCELVLDLACGTGSLAIQLAQQHGLDVIGVDQSPEMLMQAQSKSAGITPSILYLCQPMEKLDLYGTIDATVCTLDSINHVSGPKALAQIFARVALFTAPGGLFLFDANTPYKHAHILAGNSFVQETDRVLCAWQNSALKAGNRIDISLDFFEKEKDGRYTRSTETFAEQAYTTQEITAMLEKAGLAIIAQYDDYTLNPPTAQSQRVLYVAKKL